MEVRGRVAEALRRSGRRGGDARIVGVSKTFGPELVEEAAAAGLDVFGESRVREAAQKIPLCSGNLEWHLVGHLQTNKTKAAAGLFQMVHSVDSMRVLEALDRHCREEGRSLPVCIEVNVSGEASKFGFSPEEAEQAIGRCREFMNLDVVGLMTIPPVTKDVAGARPYFERLRKTRDSARAATGFDLPELSMGMSRDFEIAVEEGATMVRLGTIIFGER